jgi:hypothetical protein
MRILLGMMYLLLAAVPSSAGTIVIDFEDAAPPGSFRDQEAVAGYEYVEDGFGLDVHDADFVELYFVTSEYAATSTFVNHDSDYAVTNRGLPFTLSRQVGGTFDAISFKANHDADEWPSFRIIATGFFADNTYVQQQFFTDAMPGLETLMFDSAFKGLRVLQIDADHWMAFDEFTVVTPASVPELGTLPLAAVGALLTLAVVLRRRVSQRISGMFRAL